MGRWRWQNRVAEHGTEPTTTTRRARVGGSWRWRALRARRERRRLDRRLGKAGRGLWECGVSGADAVRATRCPKKIEARGSRIPQKEMWFRQLFVLAMAGWLQQTVGSGEEAGRHCTRDWAASIEPDMSLRTPSPDSPGVQPRKLRMDNTCGEPVVVVWVNEHGAEVQVKRLEPGRRLSTATTGGAVFRAYFVDENDEHVQLALEHKVSRLDPRMRHVDIAPCGPDAKRFVIEGATVKIDKRPKTDDTVAAEPDIVSRELLQQNRADDEALPEPNDGMLVAFSVVGGVALLVAFIGLSVVLPNLAARSDSTTRHQKRLAAARLSAKDTRYSNSTPWGTDSEESNDESESDSSSSSDSSEEEEDDDEKKTEDGAVVVQQAWLERPGAHTHPRSVSPTSSVSELSQKLNELGARDRRLADLIQGGGLGSAWQPLPSGA